MTTNKIVLLTFMLCLLPLSLSAQSDSSARKFSYNQTISFSFLGPSFYYSLNHAKVIKEFKGSTLMRQINLSYYREKDNLGHYWNNDYEFKKYYYASFSLVNISGKRNHHFVFGVGQQAGLIAIEQKLYYRPIIQEQYLNGYIFGIIGYSYWSPYKRLYVNISFYPLFYSHGNLPFFPMPGLTIGYNYRNKLTSFSRYLGKNDRSLVSLSFNQEFGITRIKTNLFGSGRGTALNNKVFITYSPSRIYFKAFLGNAFYINNHLKTHYLANEPSSPILRPEEIKNFTTALKFENFNFVSFGAGAGIRLISKINWELSIEGLIGSYTNKYLSFRPTIPLAGVNLSENIDYRTKLPIRKKWLSSAAIIYERSISSRFGLQSGFNYTYSQMITTFYGQSMQDFTFSLGLSYLLRK